MVGEEYYLGTVRGYHQYCSKCGNVLGPDDIVFSDLQKWAKEYDEAKGLGLKLPEPPEPAKTKCCGARPIYPPIPALDIPPILPDVRRVESPDFVSLIKLCNAIGKSPHAIWAYLRLDIVPSLFGPAMYFIDVKADYFKERLDEFLLEEKKKLPQG